MPINHQVTYYLQDALNLLPNLTDAELTKSFASTTNDELLVVYLSSLMRAVIALHGLVDNKAILYFEAVSTSDALTWFRAINLHIPSKS